MWGTPDTPWYIYLTCINNSEKSFCSFFVLLFSFCFSKVNVDPVLTTKSNPHPQKTRVVNTGLTPSQHGTISNVRASCRYNTVYCERSGVFLVNENSGTHGGIYPSGTPTRHHVGLKNSGTHTVPHHQKEHRTCSTYCPYRAAHDPDQPINQLRRAS